MINAGQTATTLTVPVKGDLLQERDDSFILTLSDVAHAGVVDGSGTGTIFDNDWQLLATGRVVKILR